MSPPSILLVLCFLLTACGPAAPPSRVPAAGPLTIQQVAVLADGDHLRIQVTVLFKNPTAEEVRLTAEEVPLLSAGEIIPAYTKPFADYPTVPAGGSIVTSLTYWAETRQVAGPLRLKYGPQVLPLKSAAEFKSAQLPANQSVIVSGLDWKLP